MTAANNTHSRLTILAQRWPVFFADLHQQLQQHTQGVPAEAEADLPPASHFTAGRTDFLINSPDADQVYERLMALPPDRRLIHVFHSIAQFLQFVGKPTFPACLDHPYWQPWLLLPLAQARHIQEYCERTPPRDWPWPLAKGVVQEGPAAAPAAQVGQELIAGLEQACQARLQEVEQRYADRPDPGAVLAAAERPLRVLSLAGRESSYQCYCARDIAAGMSANGVEARHLLLAGNTVQPVLQYEFLHEVAALDPDVLFLNGHTRGTIPVQVPAALPVVSWDQDFCLAARPRLPAALAPHDRLLVMLKDWQPDATRNGFPADRVAHVNIGTNTDLYYPPDETLEPECEVLFIGNIVDFEQYRASIGFDDLPEPVQHVMRRGRQRVREWLLNRDADEEFIIPDMEACLRAAAADLGYESTMTPEQWQTHSRYLRYRLAHLLLRELYVQALTEFDLRVYGRGWQDVPAVASCAHPPIENGPELRAAVQRAAINIYLHTWTVHHPRLYDTAAAGGFQLVSRVPEACPLSEVFDPTEEVDTFGSIAELKNKIRYYLDHPEQRREMARRAAVRARRDHAMSGRMAEVLKVLQADARDRHPEASMSDSATAAVAD